MIKLTLESHRALRNQWMMVYLFRRLALWIGLECRPISDCAHNHEVNLAQNLCTSIADHDWAKCQSVDLTCPTIHGFQIDLMFHRQHLVLLNIEEKKDFIIFLFLIPFWTVIKRSAQIIEHTKRHSSNQSIGEILCEINSTPSVAYSYRFNSRFRIRIIFFDYSWI